MSIIQTIRDKAAVLVFGIIAISLIGFLVQDAFVGRTHNFFDSPTSSVGSINGASIKREEFENRVKNAEAQYQSQGYRVDESMRQEIQSQIWNGLVSRQLIEGEAKKLGLGFTSKEFSTLLFSDDAPQEFKQQFTDPKTGIYNIEAARNAFKQIQKTKDASQLQQINEQLIDPIVLSQLQNKLITLFSNGVYLPKWLIEKQNTENSQVASVNFVGLNYATVPDSTVKISDAAITEYIQAHKDEFKQEASRSIAYVLFNAAANNMDSTNLWNKMEQLKPAFQSAENPGVFVTRNGSKSTYYDGFINKSRIQVPQKDSIFALPQGEVYGPYYDGNAITLARVVGSKVLPDSVRARHILIATANPQTGQGLADSIAKKRIDSIQTAIAGGASFETLAIQYSDDQGSKERLGDLGYFANGQMVKEFNDFCFDGKVGNKGVVKTQFGYHYIEVLDQKNFEMAYKIAYMAKNVEPSKETDDAANAAATKFASASRDQKSFDETVVKENLNKRIADAVKEMDYQIPGIGASRSFVKWVFTNKPGTVSDPITVGEQYVVAVITGERPKGVQSAATARLMVEPTLRNKEKAKILTQKFGKYSTVEDAAKNVAQQAQQVDSIRFSDNFKPGFGNEPIVIGAAFDKDYQTKPSQPIAGNTGVYVLSVAGISPGSEPSGDIEQERKAALMQMKQMVGYGLMQALKEAADVKDERLKAGY